MPFFEGARGQVFYRRRPPADDSADGRPRGFGVVLLPGLGQHSGDYHAFGRMLAGRGADVWTIDHVGHGMTQGEPGRTGPLEDLVDNARRLVLLAARERSRGGVPGAGSEAHAGTDAADSLVLMGHSLGAVVAAETAARMGQSDPGVCTGLVLCGVPFAAPDRTRSARRGDDDPDVLRRRGATQRARGRFARGVVVPTLVLHGADDRIVPVEGVRTELAARRDLRFVVFDGAGHDLPHEPVRGEVADMVADFASAPPAPRRRSGSDARAAVHPETP